LFPRLHTERDEADIQHRDLHEGQILIETYPSTHCGSDPLDPSTSGVKATIIDFGLSRLKAADEARVVFTPVPEDVLEGEGEQWDVYRAIDKRIQGNWEGYHPISNLMVSYSTTPRRYWNRELT
jgi:serine/threonine-protein kinase haspin